jgi:Leucine-rich repeat (LRR) protein
LINLIIYQHLTIENLSIVILSAENLKQIDMSNYIFRNIMTLDASNNNTITNVSFMKKLKILNASTGQIGQVTFCEIDQNG